MQYVNEYNKNCPVPKTFNNKVLAMKDVVTKINKAKFTPRELHIFADEDHVHLRPKRSAIVPIVTVTEGIDTSNDKRHKTIKAYSHMNAMLFSTKSENREYILNLTSI